MQLCGYRWIFAALTASVLQSPWLMGQPTPAASSPTSQPRLDEYTIHVMAQSHMDPVWRWRVYEGRDLIRDTFAQAVRFVGERDDFIFNQSSAWMFHVVEQSDPALFAAVNKAVRDGRWCIVGGTWVESDQNLPNGEAMVRQHLYGQRYFRDRFGVTATVGWNVDSFGHAWSLPQIMRKAGLRSNVITRGGPGAIVSEWIGPDGSSVTCFDARALMNVVQGAFGDIKSPAQLFTIAPRLRTLLNKLGMKHICAGTVVGDHGGGPTRRELGILDAVGRMRKMPKIILDRADRGVEAMRASAGKLPVHRDELNYTYEGCYTSQVEVKRRNRTDEQWLTTAEKACALAAVVDKADYPRRGLQGAWQDILFNQFHDILPGTSIRRAYDDVDAVYDRAESALETITESALSALANPLDTQGEGQPLMVYNPLSWRRSDLAWAILDYKTVPGSVRVRDADGRSVPGQVVSRMRIYESFERCRIVFVARDVPPVGVRAYWLEARSKSGRPMRVLDHFAVPVTEELYKAYREKGTYWKPIRPRPSGADAAVRAEATTLENALYRIRIDGETGHVVSLADKRADRELIPPGQTANRLELIEETSGSDAWELRPGSGRTVIHRPMRVEVVANGPVQAALRATYVHGGSVFEQRVTLYDGLDRIDMINQTEWRERQTMLKVRWPLAVATDRVAWEIPYGWIRKPTSDQEVPAQRWMDLSAKDHGVSMLNDGRYGHDCRDGVIAITLLRSSTRPDPVADVGEHAVTYSLWPHEGPWDPAQTVRRAAELNAPLMTRPVKPHVGKARSFSLLEVDAPSAVASAVKQAYDGQGWVVRVWETSGKVGSAKITFCRPISSAEETDLLEDRVGPADANGSTLTFKLSPHEIKTFRVEL